MLHDIRKMKEKIDSSKKEQILRKQIAEEEEKKKVYDAITRKMSDLKSKNTRKAKNEAKIATIFSFAKFAVVTIIFAGFAFSLIASFKNKNSIENIKIVNVETDAKEIDVILAKRFVHNLLNAFSSKGLTSLGEYWPPNAGEEARCLVEDILGQINPTAVELRSVKQISEDRLNVKCLHNKHPFTIRLLKKANNKIYIESID